MSRLVVTRKLGEKVMVGDEISVTVVDVRSGQVKLMFEAPPEIKINRLEVWKRIQIGMPSPSERARARRSRGEERSA